ncbi:DUF3299 domain-containing protein [Silvanigrella aquatica]|uniref:DUF3299 domain-containing protein n=1 Tax=Silvanigrella aquatica TaxID=1915309 RepID=A0A1L4CZZ1_9BACT|nr:DUF3299 domain-containing protein [Silvanigrella aquatica]APJ03497.1 hypothetical protein AXG55_06090 [Silvanigrella aquatica]
MKIFYKIFVFVAIGSILGGLFVYFIAQGASKVSPSEVQNSSKLLEVEWSQLQTFNLTTGNIPNNLRAFNGANIKIPGFIIPLEDNQDFVDEFLFVPTPMACIHVPPPPPNQIIHVKMASGKKAKMSYGPVWLFGKFVISENAGKKIKTSFELLGSYTKPYQ